jgi:hypothetical protein
MNSILSTPGLLRNNGGVIRVPFLVKGKIILPAEMSRHQIEDAFRNAEKETLYLKLPGVQLIREPVINRETMKYTGNYIYQILPPVDSQELIETDINKLARGLYALSVEDILEYLNSIFTVLVRNQERLMEIGELIRLTTEYPDAFLYSWLTEANLIMDRESARAMIDNELSLWKKPGSQFLDGWVEVPSSVHSGITASLAQGIFQEMTTEGKTSDLNDKSKADRSLVSRQKTFIRAMPTRQLHITAGNAPEVPIISALRAVLTKSAAVIKLPFGAALSGALFAMAAAEAEPDHLITQNLSVVYWQGGDSDIENNLFRPNVFDRVVIWGSPETVTAVQSHALFTRVIALNPRCGISLIGREAFDSNLEETVRKAAADSLIHNQKACTASLVHYVEGTEEQAEQYAELLQKILNQWDNSYPQFISPFARGQIKRLKRGKYVSAHWYINNREDEFASGVVVIPVEFDILDHPMCRLIVVRPVNKLEDALKYLHQGISTAGIYPEERRAGLRDVILARGVSNVLSLGQCDRLFAGMPHDGMPVLSQLVDWKNS